MDANKQKSTISNDVKSGSSLDLMNSSEEEMSKSDKDKQPVKKQSPAPATATKVPQAGPSRQASGVTSQPPRPPPSKAAATKGGGGKGVGAPKGTGPKSNNDNDDDDDDDSEYFDDDDDEDEENNKADQDKKRQQRQVNKTAKVDKGTKPAAGADRAKVGANQPSGPSSSPSNQTVASSKPALGPNVAAKKAKFEAKPTVVDPSQPRHPPPSKSASGVPFKQGYVATMVAQYEANVAANANPMNSTESPNQSIVGKPKQDKTPQRQKSPVSTVPKSIAAPVTSSNKQTVHVSPQANPNPPKETKVISVNPSKQTNEESSNALNLSDGGKITSEGTPLVVPVPPTSPSLSAASSKPTSTQVGVAPSSPIPPSATHQPPSVVPFKQEHVPTLVTQLEANATGGVDQKTSSPGGQASMAQNTESSASTDTKPSTAPPSPPPPSPPSPSNKVDVATQTSNKVDKSVQTESQVSPSPVTKETNIASTGTTQAKNSPVAVRPKVIDPRHVNNPIGELLGSKIFARPPIVGLEQDPMLQFVVVKKPRLEPNKPPPNSTEAGTNTNPPRPSHASNQNGSSNSTGGQG